MFINSFTSGFSEIDVDSLQLKVGVPMVGTCGVYSVLVRDHLPELKTYKRIVKTKRQDGYL